MLFHLAAIVYHSFFYMKAILAVMLGRPPRSLEDVQAWSYIHLVRAWTMPSVLFDNFHDFILSNSHAKRGLNRVASRFGLIGFVVFLFWPLLAPALSFHPNIKIWLENWLVAIRRPDLFISVSRGPYRFEESERVVSSLLHFAPGNYLYCLADLPDFEVDDKTKLPDLCRAKSIQSVQNLKPESIQSEKTYIVKPKQEAQGRGVMKIRGEEALRFLDGDHVIQEVLINHPKIVEIVGVESGLSTVRAITLQTTEQEFLLFGCFLRLSRPGRVVDNMSQGGIAVPIGPDGVMAIGSSYDAMKQHWRTRFQFIRHPDTLIEFVGRQLPYHAEVKALVLNAHNKLCPNMPICAWDVAVTPEGPLLVEAASYLGGGLEFCRAESTTPYLNALRALIAKVEDLKVSSSFKRVN